MLQALLNEHQNAANSDIEYTTSNYHLKCTPREELEAVLCPQPGKIYPGAGTGEGKRVLLPLRVLLSAAQCLVDYQRPVTVTSDGKAGNEEAGNEKAADREVGDEKVSHETELNRGKFASVLDELEILCGPLTLNEEDEVDEAVCLLMMAREGLATTLSNVQRDMQAEVEGGGTKNMELLFKCMEAKKGWPEKFTQTVIETG